MTGQGRPGGGSFSGRRQAFSAPSTPAIEVPNSPHSQQHQQQVQQQQGQHQHQHQHQHPLQRSGSQVLTQQPLYSQHRPFQYQHTSVSFPSSASSSPPSHLPPFYHLAFAALPPVARATMSMPPILYGTAWKGDATAALVFKAIRAGFRGVDTAAQLKHYHEEGVGEGLARARLELGIKRESLWIQTKYTPLAGQDQSGFIPYDPTAPTQVQVRQSFEHSLRALHPTFSKGKGKAVDQGGSGTSAANAGATEARRGSTAWSASHSPTFGAVDGEDEPYIDSYLLHSPLETIESTLEAWKTMEELLTEGRVRQIGIANVYDPRILVFIRDSSTSPSKLRILQNRFHHTNGHDVSLLSSLSPVLSPNDYPPDPDARGTDGPTGITYQPFWLLTGNPRLLQSRPVQRLSAAYGWTPAQVLYRFVAQGMGVPGLRTAALCGSTDDAHMKEAVQAANGLDMTEEEMASIRREIYGE